MASQRISVKTIIANVIRDAQLKDANRMIDSMIEWAYEAEMLIGSYDTFVRKECEINVKNFRARLPKDFYQFISFKIGGMYPEVTNRDFRLFYKNTGNLAQSTPAPSITNAISDESTSSRIKMSIENGYIHLSGVSGETKGGLAYLAIDLDEEGFPLIKDGHEMAVVAYILWKYKTADYINGKVAHHVYKELENRWYMLCGQARGDDEMPDPKQLEYIAAIYNQLLPMPNPNFF